MNLRRLQIEKDKAQYQTYLNNVQCLNSMKQTFRDVYPTLDPAVLQDEENKRTLAKCIMKYESDLINYV